ncbi:MAG: proline--tRNA ligase [Candidatus Omnitrophica bacterium]|nr:proline--tRNA ligase [Candidatus Omnitrophota bacterium]
MRWTKSLITTLRNVPKDAEAASHKLALRAALVRQLSSGVYSYLPLGFRVLNKIINIIREEMQASGAEEVLLPALHPAELWKKTGRYDSLGEDKISFKNRAGHEFVLGPTHEEIITDLVANTVKSFRELPITLYQIQTKFRDEARPRFGVIRTKEFIMKDAYSFDLNEEGLDKSYNLMSEVYHRIFSRCGLSFKVVQADSGMMGGKMSQEFMVICPYGEDRVAISKDGTLASVEIARRAEPPKKEVEPCAETPEVFDTPDARTIEEIASRYQVKPKSMIKTLIYVADGKLIAALVTGDSEVNEVKLRALAGAKALHQADAAEVEQATGAPVGFAGPVGLKIPVYADWDVMNRTDMVTGANQKDKHIKHVHPGRDFQPAVTGDIRLVRKGDWAPDGSGPLEIVTTMEIGHIFKLGTRYSAQLDAVFLNEKSETVPMIMGCYGIGVNRILAAAIEEHHDDKGIKWPAAIAPFEVVIVTINQAIEEIRNAAEKIYADLKTAGVDVLYDDRDERAGVKFNDADLIGIPKQIIIGERNLKENLVEIKDRSSGEASKTAVDQVVSLFR